MHPVVGYDIDPAKAEGLAGEGMVAQGRYDEDHSAVCSAMERAADCER
jgi:hypothetical protein